MTEIRRRFEDFSEDEIFNMAEEVLKNNGKVKLLIDFEDELNCYALWNYYYYKGKYNDIPVIAIFGGTKLEPLIKIIDTEEKKKLKSKDNPLMWVLIRDIKNRYTPKEMERNFFLKNKLRPADFYEKGTWVYYLDRANKGVK